MALTRQQALEECKKLSKQAVNLRKQIQAVNTWIEFLSKGGKFTPENQRKAKLQLEDYNNRLKETVNKIKTLINQFNLKSAEL
ncbi:MAG TPA: hypothetical protein ENN30_01620 [Candidatus Woesearchaeota archaeon]|nr:hypothetical protein [Candidatus Woesearchaeota archaeon]